VPASFVWTNGLGNKDFDNPANWAVSGSTTNTTPGANDDVIFSMAPTPPIGGMPGGSLSLDCDNMHGPSTGSYHSVQLIGSYINTVTLSSGFTTENLTFTAVAAISQPVSGTDITVTDNFEWTRGTLNSSTHLSSLILDGATASIAPASAGTVYLGSNFTMENGTEATMGEGTILVNKSGIEITTSNGSGFAIVPGALHEAIIGATHDALPPQGLIMAGNSWTLYSGSFTYGGPVGNAGTVTLMPDTIFAVNGNEGTGEGYLQWGTNSATYLYGGSNLLSYQPVLIQNGKLATVWAESVNSGTGTIVCPTTVTITGGDIYVGMQQGSHIHFGELLIDGNAEWTGGTFHPYVYADGVSNDVWRTTGRTFAPGTFTISGGTIAPVYLDSDYGTSSNPHSGDSWQVLKAGGGFTNNTAPSVSNADLWSVQIDPINPPIYWKLIAK
jgi:hypothetical protein